MSSLSRIGVTPFRQYSRPIEYENDMDDFRMPYRDYSLTDLELMIIKYKRLNNLSKGLNVRYGRKLI